MKNPDAPHLVQIVAESGELPYQWARIADAIPPMAEPDHAAMETALGAA